jgi:hypothetical protein
VNQQLQFKSQHYSYVNNGKRILVVEDDADISHLLKIHLQDNAFDVDVVNNGIDGPKTASQPDSFASKSPGHPEPAPSSSKRMPTYINGSSVPIAGVNNYPPNVCS